MLLVLNVEGHAVVVSAMNFDVTVDFVGRENGIVCSCVVALIWDPGGPCDDDNDDDHGDDNDQEDD